MIPIVGQILEPTAGDEQMRHARFIIQVTEKFRPLDGLFHSARYLYLDDDPFTTIPHEVPWREWESWFSIMKPMVIRRPVEFEWMIAGREEGRKWVMDNCPDGFFISTVAETLEDAKAHVAVAYEKRFHKKMPFKLDDRPEVRLADGPFVAMYNYTE